MKRVILLFIVVILISCNTKQKQLPINLQRETSTQEFMQSYNQAYVALSNSDYSEYLNMAEKIYSFGPNDFSLKLIYADALAANNKYEEAEEILNTMADLHSHLSFERIQQQQYGFVKKLNNYNELLKKLSKDTIAVNNSQIAFTIGEKDLIPEGVAYDHKTNTLFVSSINKRKIIAIDKDGKISDFIQTAQDNILSVLGMEVDPVRRHLWVCSEWDNPRKIVADSLLHSSVYKYDLETGRLIKKYILKDSTHRLLNDLTIAKNGTVYISESIKGKVYTIQPEKDSLELFIDANCFYYTNGITISDDNRKLYVSHFTSTEVVDLENNSINSLKHPENISTGRVDGLAYYQNSLIAHQDEIVRYYLNECGDSIIRKEIIERNNPLFDIPTTGEIAGDEYFYIANSQLTRIDEKGYVFPENQLDSVYILKTSLSKK